MSRPLLTVADRADVFRGLAHPLRRRIIARLAGGEVGVAELQASFHVSPQVLSQHLAILRETGLVTTRLQRPHRFYRLRSATLRLARNWMDGVDAAA